MPWQECSIMSERQEFVAFAGQEGANRLADRAVKIFGGRGYMNESPAERYYCEMRVDRI